MSNIYFVECDGCGDKCDGTQASRIETIIVYVKGSQARWTDIDLCATCHEGYIKPLLKRKKRSSTQGKI